MTHGTRLHTFATWEALAKASGRSWESFLTGPSLVMGLFPRGSRYRTKRYLAPRCVPMVVVGTLYHLVWALGVSGFSASEKKRKTKATAWTAKVCEMKAFWAIFKGFGTLCYTFLGSRGEESTEGWKMAPSALRRRDSRGVHSLQNPILPPAMHCPAANKDELRPN